MTCCCSFKSFNSTLTWLYSDTAYPWIGSSKWVSAAFCCAPASNKTLAWHMQTLWNACFFLIQIHATKAPADDKRWKQILMLKVLQKMHSEVKPVQSTMADQPETIWHTNAEPSLGTVDGILSDSVLELFLHTSPTCHAPSNPATRDFVPPNFPWPVTDAPERPEIFAQRPGDHIRQRHLI